ncbi:hypothetical protein PGW94_03675 [Candidatus Anaplasma sp. TIGMIC]|nr:hypothetical protein [Candidatus Anaplasma sp. TIGMIC]
MSKAPMVALTRGLVFFFITITCFFISVHVEAVGFTQDKFMPAPYRRGDTGFFATPEILVELLPSVLGSRLGSVILKMERWEYDSVDLGQAVGYVKREQDGKLKMCACTSAGNLLSANLRTELEYKRREQTSLLTNYDNLDLDKRIEDECIAMQAQRGCVDVTTITPNPPSFCNVFLKESLMYALPLEFSQQSYFAPGLRMFRDEAKNSSRAGGHRAYKAKSVYLGEYEGYSTGKSRGQTRFRCRGAKTFYEAIVGVKNGCGTIPSADEIQSGYAVARYDDLVCLHYKYNGNVSTDCVPFPEMSHPTVTASVTGLNIKFPDCRDKNGGKSKYCDFEMTHGDVDQDFDFAVIKPKLNMDTYDFELVSQCLDEDGKVTGRASASSDCSRTKMLYAEDHNGNVTCFVSMSRPSNRFYIKRGDRNYWLRKLPKVLVASSFDRNLRKYAQCDDSKAVDLSRMRQADIDKMVVRGSFFIMPSNSRGNSANKHGGVLCRDNMSYHYSNERAFPYSGQCSVTGSIGVLPGYCKTRYESIDNFEKVFLTDAEEPAIDHVIPLNPMLQGLCVSNFPSHSYKYEKKSKAATAVKNTNPGTYILEVSPYNASCDFLKIELWGGGEAGSLPVGGGRSGEYVMGILKPEPKKQKYLTINVGRGGTADIADSAGKRDHGRSTVVSLCDSPKDKTCPITLIARGGGHVASKINPTGLNALTHYRLAEGIASGISKDEVYLPYQNDKKSAGRTHVSDVGCVRGSNDNGTDIKAVARSLLPGAGGCARTDVGLVQSGAHGMVRVTCEKWSGSMGKIKEWDKSTRCNEDTMDHLDTLRQHAETEQLSKKTRGFFGFTATEQFCESLERFPLFTQEIGVYSEIVLGELKSFSSRSDADKWVQSAIRKLRGVLNSETGILSLPFPVSGSGPAVLSATDRNMDLITSSFAELLRSNTEVVVDRKQYRELVTFLRDYTTDRGYNVTKVFHALLHADVAKQAAESEKLVDWLKAITKVVKQQDTVFKDQARADQWVDDHATTLKKILQEKDKKIVKVYDILFPGSSTKSGGKMLSPGDISNIIETIVTDFKEFISGEIVVSAGAKAKLNVAKILRQLRKIATERNTPTKHVFTHIANDDFADKVSGISGFVQELRKIHRVVSGDKKAFDSKQEADAWVKETSSKLGSILETEPEIIKSYEEARKKAGLPVRSKDVSREEMYKSFVELVGTRAVTIDSEIYDALQLFRKYSYDAPLSRESQQLFDGLTDLDYVERISAALKASRITKYVRDIIHEGPGSNNADVNTPEGKKFRTVFDKVIMSDVGAEILGEQNGAKQLVVKRGFTELLDHIAADKIAKQIKPHGVISMLKQALSDTANAGIQHDLRLDHLVSSGSRSAMKRSNCYVMGLHYFAKGMNAIMGTMSSAQLYAGVDVDNVKASILHDLLRCVEVEHNVIADDLGPQVTGDRGVAGISEFVSDVLGGVLEKALYMGVVTSSETELRKKMEEILRHTTQLGNIDNKALKIIADETFLSAADARFRGVIDILADIASGPVNEFATEVAARNYTHEFSGSVMDIFRNNAKHTYTYARLRAVMLHHPEFFSYPRNASILKEKRKAYQRMLASRNKQELLMHSSQAHEEFRTGLGNILMRKNVSRKNATNVTKEQIVQAIREIYGFTKSNIPEIGYVFDVMAKPGFADLVTGTAFGEFLVRDLKPALDDKKLGSDHSYNDVLDRLNDVMQMKESIAILREYGRLYTESAHMIGIVNPDASNAIALNIAKENVPFGPTLTVHNAFYRLLTKKVRTGTSSLE